MIVVRFWDPSGLRAYTNASLSERLFLLNAYAQILVTVLGILTDVSWL